MNNKDKKRGIAYETLIIMGVLALLLFICRLWPILLLVILGIFVATLRLLFISVKKVEIIAPLPEPQKLEPTEKDVQDMAYGTVQRRITELVTAEYPDAKWVWKTPNTQRHISGGESVSILLNRAGGYREAAVVIRNLRVCGLEYQTVDEAPEDEMDEDTPVSEPAVSRESERPQNYELIAFEWVDAHAVELNERCNESIAQGHSAILLEASELPVKESWPDICRELDRNGIENCSCAEAGIQINLTQ